MATRRYGTIVKHLTDDPLTAVELVGKLNDEILLHLGEAIADEVQRRAVEDGDQDAVIAEAFEHGFGKDGMASRPWINGPYVVCPGAIISKNKANHRCRFVSVNDTWIWDSMELIHEEKRSSPGKADGFRAVALLPKIERMELDVVTGRARSGQHSVDHVISYEIRKGELVEVSQRNVAPKGMQ